MWEDLLGDNITRLILILECKDLIIWELNGYVNL